MLKKIQEWDFFVIFWLIISDLRFLSSFCFWRELIAEMYYYLDTRRLLWPDEMIQNFVVLVLFSLCREGGICTQASVVKVFFLYILFKITRDLWVPLKPP